MRILILGGTKFLGRALAGIALEAGHDVTLFHRGLTNPSLFPRATHVLGDRDGGLGALGNGRWDAVLDTSGYVPRVVAASAGELSRRTGRYLFVSSISAYAEPAAGPLEEDATLADPAVEEIRGDTYGGLKARCETEVLAAVPGRAIVVRPGLIVGPHDPTGRFSYWPARMARGGEVLAPGDPGDPVQVIDVRDLAGWMLGLLATGDTGTYNAVGPAEPTGMGALLEACHAAAGSDAGLVWVDETFLLEREVQPWSELPVWTPSSGRALAQVPNTRARAAGLTFRPLVETARDTLRWDRETAAEPRPARSTLLGPAPLEAAREASLLAEWRARAGVR